MTATLAANIARLQERRAAEQRHASLSERVAEAITAFTGSMTFVALHLILFGGWIAANTIGLPAVPRFDPSLVVLAMAASVEAIFLSTFVLISQNRMAAAAARRADLDLHIGLLAEHELTRVAALLEAVATHLGVGAVDPEFAEVKRDVEPETVLDTLDG
ncbi:DUF1003 domain-containing protein [Sphingomonas spermidinifaciens]|nr:DUF1003 domain-containing protein [Sphingomonas spermidinifaciens]